MVNRYLEMSTAHLKEETIGMLKDMDIPYCVNYEEWYDVSRNGA